MMPTMMIIMAITNTKMNTDSGINDNDRISPNSATMVHSQFIPSGTYHNNTIRRISMLEEEKKREEEAGTVVIVIEVTATITFSLHRYIILTTITT